MIEERVTINLRNGVVAWIEQADVAFAGLWRWSQTRNGYVARYAGNRRVGTNATIFLHRELLGLPTHLGPGGLQGDHINGDKLDNRRSNLRVVTGAENKQNLTPRRGGSSTYRGVCWDANRERWMARASVGGVPHSLGRWDDELQAARTAEAFRRAHMPFARANLSLEPLPPCRCEDCR